MHSNKKSWDKEMKKKLTEAKDVYMLDFENYKRLGRIYTLFKGVVDQNDGFITDVVIEPTSTVAKITAEAESIALRGEALKNYIELIGLVDLLEVSYAEEDLMAIEISVFDVWKAANNNE